MAILGSLARNQAYWTDNNDLAQTNSVKSISFWFKIDTITTAWGFTLAAWYESGYPNDAGIYHYARLELEVIQGSTASNFRLRRWSYPQNGSTGTSITSGDFDPSVWHSICFAFTGTAVNVYVDGVLFTNHSSFPNAATSCFTLGGAYFVPLDSTDRLVPNRMMNCKIADLIVWDATLSLADTGVIYASRAPKYGRTATTNIAGISSDIILRCPFESHLKDIVTDTPVFTSNLSAKFVDDSDLFGTWDDSNLITNTNPGVASNYILGTNPGNLWCFSDSFGGFSHVRLLAPLYNRLSYNRYGSISTNGGISTSGAAGTITTVSGANNYRVENGTNRIITGESYANGVKTLTYNGPNILVGQTIRVNSVYYNVTSFTPGSGVGTSQTGAQITFNVTPDPGSLMSLQIHTCLVVPSAAMNEIFSNGSSTAFAYVTVGNITDYASTTETFNIGAVDKILEDSSKTMTIRVYHRIASDVNQQVKAVKLQIRTPQGTYQDYATVTGLDDSSLAGTIQVLEIRGVPQSQYSGGTGNVVYQAAVVPTATAGDHTNRYFTLVQTEWSLDDDNLRLIDISESSWGIAGLTPQTPGFKSMDSLTINALVKGFGINSKPNVVMIGNMDMEVYTVAQWMDIYDRLKTAWDHAFDLAGLDRPKYLLLGMYMHAAGGASPTTRSAVWRQYFVDQNIAAMKFAKLHPNDVEFISLYESSLGLWEMPLSTDLGVRQPSPMPSMSPGNKIDPRWIPHKLLISNATWNEANKTITSSNAFTDYNIPGNGTGKVFVARTAVSGTPVFTGWYTISGATGSVITLNSSITSGSSGVGSDVAVYAITSASNALHPMGFLPSVYADMILCELSNSVKFKQTYKPMRLNRGAVLHYGSGSLTSGYPVSYVNDLGYVGK